MPVIEKIQSSESIIGVFQLQETIDELEKLYSDIRNSDEQIRSFQHEKRKREWLAVRILIAQLLETDFAIEYDKNGRPNIRHEKYHYLSISHSSEYVAVYIHQTKSVGIDIESLDRRFAYVEKKYLSEDELVQVQNHPHFRAIYWCCKEAIFKWAGREGVDFRKQINIKPFLPDSEQIIQADFYDIRANYVVQLRFIIFRQQVIVFTL